MGPTSHARLIAFYLPQFHPIPENDEWWGKGFTEWTNVAKARPLFPGHYQPHIPADLGFYDLRLPEVRQAQADLAKEYGIHGFCYYHYWFDGKRLLERPFNEVLESGAPDFPFCLCWANENWTRSWDGCDEQLLVQQKSSPDDDLRHIRWLVSAFRDERYIRIDDRPLFLVYRANKLSDSLKTTSIWREEARSTGIGEIFLCRVESFADERGDPAAMGFDAAVEFQPDWCNYGPPRRRGTHHVYDYSVVVERMLEKAPSPYRRFPCVTPSWDNSARRKAAATILTGPTPTLYEKWLTTVLQRSGQTDRERPIAFVNAWNEWGEGNHLEPCHKWERAYLEATRNAVINASVPVRSVQPVMHEGMVKLSDATANELTIKALRIDAAEILRRVREELTAAAAELEETTSEVEQWTQLQQATQEIMSLIPSESMFILVDDNEWSTKLVGNRRAIPFLERDGEYWGAPPDDESAIRELERLRRRGASFMVFAWPAFWWLDHYTGLRRHLHATCRCVLENDRLVVFDLRR